MERPEIDEVVVTPQDLPPPAPPKSPPPDPDPEPSDLDQVFEETDEKPAIDPADKDNPPAPDVNPDDFGDTSNLGPDTAPAPAVDFSAYKASAENLVAFADTAGQLGWPLAYRAKLFNPGEYEKAFDLYTRYKHAEANGTGESFSVDEMKLIFRYGQHAALVQKIPFSEKEKKMLTDPLARVCEKYKWTFGPEGEFILAASAVIGSRAIPLVISI